MSQQQQTTSASPLGQKSQEQAKTPSSHQAPGMPPQQQSGQGQARGTGAVSGSSGEFPTQPQQQPGGITRSGQRQRRARMSPESISVIICGWPDQAAENVAKACKKRGYSIAKFGLCQDNCDHNVDVSEVGKIECVKFSDPNAKQRLQKCQQDCQQEQKSIVLVDASPDAAKHVQMYNELKIPFVLQSQGGEAHNQAVRDTELARSTALISETMSRQLSVLDNMWTDMSRRFPGLFDDFDLEFRSTNPRETPRSLMNSISDIMNREFNMDQIQQFDDSDKKKFTEGNVTREYTFKDGSGRSSFTFRQTVDNDQEYADTIADSVGFLAQKTQELSRPQVYNILDVAQENRLLNWF
jgi:hypothetical protein